MARNAQTKPVFLFPRVVTVFISPLKFGPPIFTKTRIGFTKLALVRFYEFLFKPSVYRFVSGFFLPLISKVTHNGFRVTRTTYFRCVTTKSFFTERTLGPTSSPLGIIFTHITSSIHKLIITLGGKNTITIQLWK